MDKKGVFVSPVRGCNRAQVTKERPATYSQSIKQKRKFASTVAKSPWRHHQSLPIAERWAGYCTYVNCPGKRVVNGKIRVRAHKTKMRCEECSVKAGRHIYLCNTTRRNSDGTYRQVLCHTLYHNIICTPIAVASPIAIADGSLYTPSTELSDDQSIGTMEDLSDLDSYYIPPSVQSSDCTTTAGINLDSDTESECSGFVVYNTDSDSDSDGEQRNSGNEQQEKDIVKKVTQEDEAAVDMLGLYNRHFGGYIRAMQARDSSSNSSSSSSSDSSSD